MRKLTIAVAALALWAGSSVTAHADSTGVANGIGPASGNAVASSAVVDAPAGGLINFDDDPAPCNFIETVALRTVGNVRFKGLTGPNDGGAILDECGSFGVTGHSSPNFLAWNCGASLSDGGVPQLPERIVFPSQSTNVSLNVGTPDVGQSLTLVAKGSDGRQKRTVTLGSTLQTVNFTKPVKRITIKADTNCILVLDDLAFS